MVARDYELGFILNPEVSEEQAQTILGRVEQIVATHGGQIMRVNKWGRRRLSYPIDHHRDGNYIFLDMILTPETVAELDRTLRVSEEVLRHLMKRRDTRTVQKEREAHKAAEAAAKANAAAQTQAPGTQVQSLGGSAESVERSQYDLGGVSAPDEQAQAVGTQFIAPDEQPQEQEQAGATTANVEGNAAAVEEALANTGQDAIGMGENFVEPIALTEEDMVDVPPAIDDETVE